MTSVAKSRLQSPAFPGQGLPPLADSDGDLFIHTQVIQHSHLEVRGSAVIGYC